MVLALPFLVPQYSVRLPWAVHECESHFVEHKVIP